jgi:NAD(P)H-hydrate epimerase
VVLDADALSVFANDADGLSAREGQDVVITPHPGEMARLLGTSVEHVQTHRVELAREMATRHRVHVVLKGHRSLVAHPDGTVAVNVTGNPGMGTGGTGDVLTGVIAAWLAQLLDTAAACRLAVYVHGLAGDLTEADEGAIAMTAGDLVLHLGDAVMELTSARRTSS